VAVADDLDHAGDCRVLGFGEEGLRALAGDSLDLVEEGADMGLVGPEGELVDGGVELLGEIGEAEVVVEPDFQALAVEEGEGCGMWVATATL
jgi:hypothetical protein